MKRDANKLRARKNADARQHAKLCRRVLPALIAACFACSPAWANPTGAQVVNGQVNIVNNGKVLTVTNSPGAIINWQNFSINPGELTQFQQQNANSAVLNRIVGQDPSQIFGALQSNGKVYLINPNGILFGDKAQVNVGALVASTLDIGNTDFLAGRNNFNAPASGAVGSVVNQGSIVTPAGGQIYLIAPQVQNSGILTSPQGEILLAAGHSVQLVDGGDPNLQVTVSAPADQALNLGQVLAQGGKVGIYGALVNQGGIVSADSAVRGENGQIVFKSSQTTMLSGNSVTSAQGVGSGGTIYLEGPQVGLTDNAQVNASGQSGGGTVLLGGGFHGTNSSIENAIDVYIGSNAAVKADAIQSGKGGEIAVWSEQQTKMLGNLSAQGGMQGGDGGFIEASSHLYLDYQGHADLHSPHGKGGTLLLDPYSVTITDSGATPTITPTGTGPFTWTGSINSYIPTATLNSQLGGINGSVSILAPLQAGPSAGNITVAGATPIAWSGPYGANTLTLTASGNISIAQAINGPGGALSMSAAGTAGITQTAGGTISVGTLSAVASNGPVTLNSANAVNTVSGSGTTGFSFKNTAPGGTLTISPSGMTTSGSAISVTETGAIRVTGNVTSGGGTIAMSGTSVSVNGGTGPLVKIDAGGGSTSLTATTGAIATDAFGEIGGTAGDSASLTAATAINVTSGVDSLTVPSAPGGVAIANAAPSGTLTVNGIATSNAVISLTESGIGGIAVAGPINAAGGVVGLMAGNGAISGSGTVSGSALTLSAYSGIGAVATPLHTAVGYLQASNGMANDIAISNTDTGSGLMVPRILQSAAGKGVYLNNTGNLTVGALPFLVTTDGSTAVITGLTPAQTSVLSPGMSITSATGTGSAGLTALTISSVGSTSVTLSGPTTAAGTASVSFGFAGLTNSSGNVALHATAGGISVSSPISAANGIVALLADAGDITQSGAIAATSLSAAATTGSVTLNDYSANAVGTVAGTASGANGFSFEDNSAITVGSVAAVGVVPLANGITSLTGSPNSISLFTFNAGGVSINGPINGGSGNVHLGANGGSIVQLSANSVTTSGTVSFFAQNNVGASGAPVLTNGGSLTTNNTPVNFYVNNGSTAATITGISASGAVVVNSIGALTLQCASTFCSDSSGILTGASATLTSQNNLTVSNVGTSFPMISTTGAIALYAGYNGTTYPTTTNNILTTSGTFVSGTSSYAYYAGGPINGSTTVTGPYHPCQNMATLACAPVVYLTVSGESANNKIYDGTTSATLSGGTLVGVLPGDSITLNQVGNFVNKNVGTGIGVNANDSLTIVTNASGDNYILIQPTGLFANITPAMLTVVGQSAAGRVYNGNTLTSVSGGSLAGVFYGDVVSLTTTNSGNFATKNVGVNIPVTLTAPDTISGANAANYTLQQPALTASITPATLTLAAGQTASNKTYDGTTAATLSAGVLSGILPGDSVTLNATGSFASKNVGTNIAVTAQETLGGADGGNYVLAQQPTGLAANITPATLTVSGQIASNKTYDTTTAATVSGGSLSGVFGTDAVTLTTTNSGTFASKNVGTNIPVTLTAPDTISGADAGNYTLQQPTLTAAIKPAAITVSGQSANNKTYDGTTAATLAGGTLTGVLPGDTVTLNGNGSFATKNVGNNIAVTAQDSLGGADGGNYVLAQQPTGLAANITQLGIAVAATGSNKVYNGDTADVVTLSSTGVLKGDTVTFSNTAANFANANAGNGKTVTVTGITASGADAGNYTFAGTTTTVANITPAPLTVTGEIAQNKVYDGSTAAVLTGGTLNGVLAADASNVTLTQAGNFASANIGNGISVVAADGLSGSAASNYTLVQPTGLMANIVGATVVTQATPVILASNSYIVAINTQSSTLLNTGGTSGSGGLGGNNNPGSGGLSGNNNSGETNNGNVKKLYCD